MKQKTEGDILAYELTKLYQNKERDSKEFRIVLEHKKIMQKMSSEYKLHINPTGKNIFVVLEEVKNGDFSYLLNFKDPLIIEEQHEIVLDFSSEELIASTPISKTKKRKKKNFIAEENIEIKKGGKETKNEKNSLFKKCKSNQPEKKIIQPLLKKVFSTNFVPPKENFFFETYLTDDSLPFFQIHSRDPTLMPSSSIEEQNLQIINIIETNKDFGSYLKEEFPPLKLFELEK